MIKTQFTGIINKDPIFINKKTFKNFINKEWDSIEKKGNRVHFKKDKIEYIFTKLNTKTFCHR